MLLWFLYACGISGYWLVWDRLAQYIAVVTAEWFDWLPLFGESIARNFLDSATVSDRFFSLMFFMHLGNLAAHYLAADHAAQAGFINELKLGLFGVATLIVIWRLPRFLDDVSAALAHRKEVL